MRRSITKIVPVFLLIALLLVVACGKLTPENYSKLKMSMPYDDVVAIFGAPDRCDAAMKIKDCNWGDEKRSINVKFLNEKVILFSAQGL